MLTYMEFTRGLFKHFLIVLNSFVDVMKSSQVISCMSMVFFPMLQTVSASNKSVPCDGGRENLQNVGNLHHTDIADWITQEDFYYIKLPCMLQILHSFTDTSNSLKMLYNTSLLLSNVLSYSS